MKLVKIFGVVMAVHAAAFMFVFAIPGCRSSKKPAAGATAPEASPIGAPELGSPIAASSAAPTSDTAGVRFSPTRPNTPAAVAVEAPVPASTATAESTHTVIKGDSLWTIARKHNITVKQLTAANNLRSDSTLKLGQKLTIPGAKAAPAASSSTTTATGSAASSTTTAAATTSATHTVKSGETLGAIAKKYQVKVGDIATANNIADPAKLRVGQTLKIPGQAARASTATPAASSVRPATTAPKAPVTTTPATATPAQPNYTTPIFEPSSPVSPVETSPIAPAPSDAPLIRVEESGAPKIE